MKLPLEIVSQNTVLSPHLREQIETLAEKLDHFYRRIMRCRVTVLGPGRHATGGRWEVKLDLTVPHREITVTHQHGETLAEAIREAFAAAGRRVEDYIRRRRQVVQKPSRPTSARVVRLFPGRGFGFLEDVEGREIYFHRNSVLAPGFGALTPGSPVRFSEEAGEKGPQASTVAPVRGVVARRAGNG